MSNPEAEAKKELGNKAFSVKDYDEAIKQYTAAIAIDSKNCVYFSNRSACHAGKKDWENAVKDAKECIKANPTFIKGYYRLASAQSEQNEFDLALSTIKQGMAIEADNNQLVKLQRQIKARKASSKRAKSLAKSASAAGEPGAGGLNLMDSSVSKEVADLQQQFVSTSKEYQQVRAKISYQQRERKSNEITKREMEKLPASSDSKTYMCVGKMYMLTSRDDVMSQLDESITKSTKEEEDLSGKLSYLERRMNGQKQNIQELTKSAAE